jgi:toxin FitB
VGAGDAHSQPYLAVVSVLELEIGALVVERRDRKHGAILRAWIEGHVLPSFSGRILAITVVAQRCASLHVPNARSGQNALIATTALVHAMMVVTRMGAISTQLVSPTVWTLNTWAQLVERAERLLALCRSI